MFQLSGFYYSILRPLNPTKISSGRGLPGESLEKPAFIRPRVLRALGLEFRVSGLGFRVLGLEFRVQGLGFRA